MSESLYVLAGHESDTAYVSWQPAWEPAREYEDLESAVADGQRWLRERPFGQVEVMLASPDTFDDHPSSFVRGLGVVCVVFFGVGTLVALVRRRRAGGRS